MTCKVYRLPRSWWAPPAQQTTVPPAQVDPADIAIPDLTDADRSDDYPQRLWQALADLVDEVTIELGCPDGHDRIAQAADRARTVLREVRARQHGGTE